MMSLSLMLKLILVMNIHLVIMKVKMIKMFVGVLGMGVPRLARLRPAAWLKEWPSTAHLRQHMLKTLARGQASRGRTIEGFLRHGLVRLAREEAERSRRGTSRGARDASHDDQGRQAGASPRSVLLSPLVQRGQAQPRSTEASGKGCHFGATRPRPGGRQDGGHCGAQDSVTTRALCRRRILLSG